MKLQSLLDELKEEASINFEIGSYFETLKSIYPSTTIDEAVRNIKIDNKKATIPLASSLKAKKEYIKEESFFKDFFYETTRGDILEVVKISGNKAYCKNRSLKEEVVNKYYSNEKIKLIEVTIDDIFEGNVKRVYRGVKSLLR